MAEEYPTQSDIFPPIMRLVQSWVIVHGNDCMNTPCNLQEKSLLVHVFRRFSCVKFCLFLCYSYIHTFLFLIFMGLVLPRIRIIIIHAAFVFILTGCATQDN